MKQLFDEGKTSLQEVNKFSKIYLEETKRFAESTTITLNCMLSAKAKQRQSKRSEASRQRQLKTVDCYSVVSK